MAFLASPGRKAFPDVFVVGAFAEIPSSGHKVWSVAAKGENWAVVIGLSSKFGQPEILYINALIDSRFPFEHQAWQPQFPDAALLTGHFMSLVQSWLALSDRTTIRLSSVGLRTANDWRKESERLLDEVAGAPTGWDSYGSPPPTVEAVTRARRLILALEDLDLPAPLIYPVRGGGLQFEWSVASRGLELEVLPDGSAEFLAIDGDQMQEGSLSSWDAQSTRTLAGWLIHEGRLIAPTPR